MQRTKWGKNSGKVDHQCGESDGKDMGRVEDGDAIKKRGKLYSKGMGKLEYQASVEGKSDVNMDSKSKGTLDSKSEEEVGVNACSMEREKIYDSHEESVDAECYETAVMVPLDFVCGISKRVMEDPVVVASGQTYERTSIQAWLDAGNTHCPITQKPLSHLHLTPNLTMKTLISSWMASHSCNLDTTTTLHSLPSSVNSFSSCPNLGTLTDAHHHRFPSDSSSSLPKLLRDCQFDSFSSSSINSYSYGIPKPLKGTLNDSFSSAPSTSDWSSCWEQERDMYSVQKGPPRMQKGNLQCKSDDPNMPSVTPSIYIVSRINTLVSNLQSEHVDKLRSSATELRLLAKNDEDNRMMIANAGALGPLVALLQSSDETTQQEATTTLLNLSLNHQVKADIVKVGAIEPLVRVLREGLTSVAMENAAVTLVNLAVGEENKAKIGSAGAISPLVDLLDNGSTRGKKDAATALYSLSSIDENKKRIVRAGATRLLVDFMSDDGSIDSMVDKAIAILRNLVSIEEGRVAFVEEGGITFLLQIIQTGSRRSKELAVSILLQLCSHSTKHRFLVLQKEPLPALMALSKSRNSRLNAQVAELIYVLTEAKASLLKKVSHT